MHRKLVASVVADNSPLTVDLQPIADLERLLAVQMPGSDHLVAPAVARSDSRFQSQTARTTRARQHRRSARRSGCVRAAKKSLTQTPSADDAE